MKFGAALPFVQQMPFQPAWQHDDDPTPLIAVAQRADELGYAWVPCSDHIVVPERALGYMGATWYEPGTTLAFIAGCTTRVRLLSHVIVLPYHSPLEIAKQYATLDRLSGGRVVLGVGVGHLQGEFEALGAPYEGRGAVADEQLRVIRALWTEAPASFSGARYSFEGLHLAPRPVQQPHPPIWVGGNSRRAARRAAELADGWVPFAVSQEEIRDRLDYVRALPAYRERPSPLEVVIPAPTVRIEARAIDGERETFAGSAEQVSEDIRSYQALGATGMTVGFRVESLAEQLEQMERFAREVAPAFA